MLSMLSKGRAAGLCIVRSSKVATTTERVSAQGWKPAESSAFETPCIPVLHPWIRSFSICEINLQADEDFQILKGLGMFSYHGF